MKRLMVRTTVLVVGIAVLAACAMMTKMSSSEAIAARQKLMKEQGAAMKSITDKAKAGQAQQVGPDAQKLVETSKQIPALFPEGSLDPNTSRAKPEIWQKRSEFEGYAKSLNTKAGQLAAMAPSGDPQATSAAIADLGKTTCGACHNAFRGPELKK
ncbi:MAG TPA: cytochrome c [Methylomirabilota bacterium]|jgi:cytochrome c556